VERAKEREEAEKRKSDESARAFF